MIKILSDNPLEFDQWQKACLKIGIKEQSSKTVIFKIKANIQNCIELYPVIGFISDNGQNWSQQQDIEIKFKGNPSQIPSLKIQICWIEIQQTSLVLSTQPTKQELSEIYNDFRKSNPEYTLICNFRSSILCQKHQQKQSVHSQASQFRFETKMRKQQKEKLAVLNKEYGNKQQIQQKTTHKYQCGQQKKEEESYQLWWYMLLGLLLGISFGIKLYRLSAENVD